MRKGFFASVAALVASAGVTLGQNYAPPPMPQPGYPAQYGPGAGMPGAVPPGDPSGFLVNPAGFQGGPVGEIPPATEMPLNGPVPGPNYPHPYNPAAEPKIGKVVGQVHKAAGGPDRWYIDLEDQIWRIKKMPFNYPLITSGPASSAGIVGADGTIVRVGNEPFDYGNNFHVFHGVLGIWDCCRVWGWEGGGFVTEGRSQIEQNTIQSTSKFLLARPVINSLNDPPLGTSLLLAFPGQFGGTSTVTGQFQMGGAEGNIMRSLVYCDTIKLNVYGGLRYLGESEDLLITSTSFFPTAIPELPDTVSIADQFNCTNQFIGAQLGFQSEWRCRRVFVGVNARVAGGNMNERVEINGNTQINLAGTITDIPAGLLALSSNISNISRNEFAYVNEATLKFGYQWTQRISGYVGYNGLYISRVVRPGQQIDPLVNPTLVPVSQQFGLDFGTITPRPLFRVSDLWAQGIVFGMSINY